MIENKIYDVAIIGCGVIGAAAAYELSKYNADIIILEKENDVACGTSKANSAIIHAGYDPEPGTQMARLNVRGNELMDEICEKLDVPFKRVGSLVLAFSEEEMKTVDKLYKRGIENGVPGVKVLSGEEVLKMEPNLSAEVKCALYAPSAGIISPWELTLAMAENAVTNGAEFVRNFEVKRIIQTMVIDTNTESQGSTDQFCYIITNGLELVRARRVINAAGIGAQALHDMVAETSFETKCSRGEYYLLDHSEEGVVDHIIFQCPGKDGKGVLVAPTVHGNIIVGPDAADVEGDDTSNTTEGLKFVEERAHISVPKLNLRASIRNFAGVRANTNCSDFIIGEAAPGFIDLAGIKSPGLSSAPAIAEDVIEIFRRTGVKLVPKIFRIEGRTSPKPGDGKYYKKVRFKELSEEARAELVEKNPKYGHIICRCETITEGEILDAIHSVIPPVSIDGVKRRCNAGMGRCQGGFCSPRVLELIHKELGISPYDVLQDKNGSKILLCESKRGKMEDL